MTALHERRKNMKEICFAEVKTVQDNSCTGKLFFSSAAFYDIIIALDFFPELQTLNKVKIFSNKIYKS